MFGPARLPQEQNRAVNPGAVDIRRNFLQEAQVMGLSNIFGLWTSSVLGGIGCLLRKRLPEMPIVRFSLVNITASLGSSFR